MNEISTLREALGKMELKRNAQIRKNEKLRTELEDVRQQRETLKRDYEEIHELWRLASFECKDLSAEVERRGEMLKKAQVHIKHARADLFRLNVITEGSYKAEVAECDDLDDYIESLED